MDIHGHPWIAMHIHWYPLISIDIHGDPVFLWKYVQFSKRPHPTKTNMLPHMAIEGVLTRQKWPEKWCATSWNPVPPDLVALICEILNVHDFWHSWKVSSWQSTSKLGLGYHLKLGASDWRSVWRKNILKNDLQHKYFLKMNMFSNIISFRENCYLLYAETCATLDFKWVPRIYYWLASTRVNNLVNFRVVLSFFVSPPHRTFDPQQI